MVTMVKLAFFTAIFIFVMIVVFFIMVYLMTTINPPPINLDKFSDNKINRSFDKSRKSDYTLKNDAVLPLLDNAQFGLEKIDADEIDFFQSTGAHNVKYNSIENISVGFRFTPRKIIPPLWPRRTQMIVIDPTMHIVIPPIWPTTLEKLDTMSSSTVKVVVNASLTSNDNITNDTLLSKTNKTIIKSMKRRSVNNNKSNVNSGSVILKILDNEAKPRIEIKLGSDMLLNGEKPEGFMSFIGKRKLSIQSEINGQHQNSKLAKDTIISIMPNDSIIIDEFEGKPVFESEKMDIKDLISSMISIDGTDEENKDYPLYEDNISHDVVFENKTIYLRNMVANSSNFEVANISHINDTKTTNITKNSTDFHTLAYAKMNNTVYNKSIIEEDGSTISVTNVVKNQGNDTILGNIVVFTNDTDFFNENDSDLVVY